MLVLARKLRKMRLANLLLAALVLLMDRVQADILQGVGVQEDSVQVDRVQEEPVTCVRCPRPIVYPCPDFAYDAYYDLENNITRPSKFVEVVSPITGQGCYSQGVLKIVLASAAEDPNRRRLLVDLFFTNPTGWVFNLGDSATDNGYAGDAGTQSWDAEVHGNTNSFLGYLSDVGGNGQTFNIANAFSFRATLVVGDGQVTWLFDNSNFNYYSNPGFFSLNGQPDSTGPVNYDLFLGINRVIYGPSGRTGSGLCRFGIRFLPEY